jgi:hypothetical protein
MFRKYDKNIDLLCMLGDHNDEREIVHPQSGIEELISVNEEDNVFHSVFNNVRVGFYPLKSKVN